MTTSSQQTALNEYADDKRLAVYKMITAACTHLYSKGKLQEEKFAAVAPLFADLAKNDPIFMAHLTAWAAKGDHKDLKVLTTFFNSLNDADGTPFFKGASKTKPNYRQVSAALLQTLAPHLALYVLELCHKKFSVQKLLNHGEHFSGSLKTAFRKYIQYREQNLGMLRGIKRSGMARKMRNIYRLTHTRLSDEAVNILNWKQRKTTRNGKEDGRIPEGENFPDFSNMTSQEIAKSLGESKLSITVALTIIPPEKITAAVAKALLENCTGNQSIILYNWFNKNGFLDVKSIKALFSEKVKESTTAVDRIDTLTKDATAEDKKEMAVVRSEHRKRQAATSKLGRIFLHIDKSGSMNTAIEFAKEKAAIIAECVDSPDKNFGWGLFGGKGQRLKVPGSFTKEDFYQALYGVKADGGTDCVALYEDARNFGAEVDIYVTDEDHNVGDIASRITQYHAKHPDKPKPKAAVIIHFKVENRYDSYKLSEALKKLDIPTAEMKPESLTESALVAQSVRTALVGELAIIDEILDTHLPTLPKWWNDVGSKKQDDAEPVSA